MRPNTHHEQQRGNAGRSHRSRHLHRWLGLGSLVFVVLLSVTGIALNHSSGLGMDESHIRWSWLLDWYGIEAPPVESSYAVADHRVTLLGERLYFDQEEIAAGVLGLTGAAAIPRFFVVATDDSVLLLTRSGALVERIAVSGELPGAVQAIGTARSELVLRSGDALFQADEELLGFDVCNDIPGDEVQWSKASPVPAAELSALNELYRGNGVTVERFIADLHSGRLFTGAGPIVMDAVGVILIALSFLGIMVWVRGARANGNGRRNGR